MTPKMQRALLALLRNPTKEAAAAEAGITSKTLRNYLENEEFQREYRVAFSEMVSDAARQAQKTMSPALTVLQEIMEDDAQNGQIRVSAARSLLEFGVKMTEQLDIVSRLDELEAAVGDDRGH